MSRQFVASVGVLVLLTVFSSGCGSGGDGPSAETSRELRQSLSHYATYLGNNSTKFSHWADTIMLKVNEGSASKAASRYAASRVSYGHIDPAAQTFAALNAEVEQGFREIEKAIFDEERTAGMKAVAKQLRIDVEELDEKIQSAELPPTRVLAKATEVLEGIPVRELAGKAERYSQTQLTAVSAQAEGAEAAFEAAKPLLLEANPELVRRIEAQFEKVYATLGEYGILARDPDQTRPQEPGIAFIVFSELSPEEIQEVAQPLKMLAALFAQADTELADS